MLHILWMLLKFILIVLGIILGLVLLALLLVLFCPVRYRADVSKENGSLKLISATVSVSWLFHGIWLRFFLKDGSVSPDIRILGIPVAKLLKKRKTKPVFVEQEEPKQENGPESELIPENPDDAEDFTEEETEEAENISFMEKNETESNPEISEAPDQERVGIFRRIWNKISSFWEKLREIRKKVMDGFRKFTLTLRNIYDKIDWWKEFLSHPRTQEALSLIKSKAVRLLRHVFPTRIQGEVTFGSEDPSVTGTVLAVLGITMPFHKNRIEICPVFDGTNIFEGNVQLKGRIYGFVLLQAAIEIYFNKNVKYVIRRWKHKEG